MKLHNNRNLEEIVWRQICIVASITITLTLLIGGTAEARKQEESNQPVYKYIPLTTEICVPNVEELIAEAPEIQEEHTETKAPEVTKQPVNVYKDPNNAVYPFNTMSLDWGADAYEQGFNYYHIPEEYTKAGGCFPEVVQLYLWNICKERGLDYYIVVALIERESNYQHGVTGDSGNSKGYMQIQERWHKERMEAEAVKDLYNPYDNIRVGVNLLEELYGKYNNWSLTLMCYNMGESKANKLWNKGIYNSSYSSQIINRAEEIKQEIEQD